jgi:hypothetical protein
MIIVAVILSTLTVSQPCSSVKAQHSFGIMSLPPTANLTVVGIDGSAVFVSSSMLESLPFIRAPGGYKNKVGTITGPDNYTGVAFNTLANLVGGVNSSEILRVVATDGYNLNFTYSQVNGNFPTYNKTGYPTSPTLPITPIVAYYKNDQNITAGGPLRSAIVGDEALITDSKYWVQQVIRLEVLWIHDLAITSVKPSKTVVGRSYQCHINVTVLNMGGYSEIFNVTLYANSTVINLQTLTLGARMSSTLSMSWDTTAFSYGNYNVTATASVVKFETSTGNNVLKNTLVLVTVPGDTNGDHTVNVLDLILVASHLGHTNGDGHTPYSADWYKCMNTDVNNDGQHNVLDLITCASHLGQNW